MDCEFFIQDPTSPDTVYLFEAIIGASRGASSCTGMFAFASRAGVDSLIGDSDIQVFLNEATMSLIVGIDAVTNRQTLVRLQELEREHEALSVRVFWNLTDALFHPKLAHFEYPCGRRRLIVGSGNLTPGGLRQNFEAFSVTRAGADEDLDLSSWDRFLVDHAADIRSIDEKALERAARNLMQGRAKHKDVEPGRRKKVAHGTAAAESMEGVELPVGRTDRFLVARVPKADDRWHQIHFNKDVIERFFRIQPSTAQRVYLVECRSDGTFGEEEVRPCVYSQSNKNLKIEVASHHGEPYPGGGQRPVAVYRELQARSFAYMLLLPGDRGYDEMFGLTETLPKVGLGLERVITDSVRIRSTWATCPLITAIDSR